MKNYNQKFQFSKLSKNIFLIFGALWFALFTITYLFGEKNIFLIIVSLIGIFWILFTLYLDYKISKVNELKIHDDKLYIKTLFWGIKKEYNFNFDEIRDYQLLAELNGWTIYIITDTKMLKLQGVPANNNIQCSNYLNKVIKEQKSTPKRYGIVKMLMNYYIVF